MATFWDALCDLPIESVLGASQHAARYWRPTPHERFPAPLTVREYAAAYREQRKQHAAREAEKRLPQWSTTPDEVGLTVIRDILRSLGEDMTMRHPVYQHPSLDDPEKRREELREQVRHILAQERDGHVARPE